MKVQSALKGIAVAGLMALTACNVNLDTGNLGDQAQDFLNQFSSDNRELFGEVPQEDDSLSENEGFDRRGGRGPARLCRANEVVATDDVGEETLVAVNDDCTFSLPVRVGDVYTVDFYLDDEFVASLSLDDLVPMEFAVHPGRRRMNIGVLDMRDGCAVTNVDPEQEDDLTDDSDSDDDEDEIEDEDETEDEDESEDETEDEDESEDESEDD